MTDESNRGEEAPVRPAPVFTPGSYRLSELATKMGVSRTSVERYVKRYGLEPARLSYKNKVIRGVYLDEEKAAIMTELAARSAARRSGPATAPALVQDLINQMEAQKARLKEIELAMTQMETEQKHVKALERLLASKENEIATLKKSLALMERIVERPPEKPRPFGPPKR